MIYVGTATARLGPAAALVDTSRGAFAACEENRLTRAVHTGTSGPPDMSIDELLRFLGSDRSAIAGLANVDATDGIDPHRAHAAYAFAASGFESAVVLVCDAHNPRGWSAWQARVSTSGLGLADMQPVEIDGRSSYPIADAYGRLTAKLGFRPMRDEHLVEALARGGHPDAAPVQRRLGDELLELVQGVTARATTKHVCLSGGIFFNTYFTTLVAGAFKGAFIPPHPGRNGAAMGAALLAASDTGRPTTKIVGRSSGIGSPYLGPSYSDADIKATLENCKLSFDLVHEQRLFDVVMRAIDRGQLVGWYHGRLEWGPRALGHRSVLADPFAPHVLENLNGFLKRRPAYRAYGVSVPLDELDRYFERPDGSTPLPSPFMQYEYRPKDLDKFRTILPRGAETLRVHTVDDSEPRFLRLLQSWGAKSGAPVLVNTSFNGFHEPLVCSPRDAVRVFYGTGLDVLALEDFYLRK